VWVVNGEDKADFLVKEMKLIATAAPFKSSTKWKKEFNKYLLKAKAIIVLDENKEEDTNYISKTFITLRGDLENLGLVSLVDLANELNVNLSENDTLLKFAEKLNNNSKLKELLLEVEEQM
jgi:hypothetical protein